MAAKKKVKRPPKQVWHVQDLKTGELIPGTFEKKSEVPPLSEHFKIVGPYVLAERVRQK